MTTYTSTQQQNILADIFLINEAKPFQWYKLSNAGFAHNWRNDLTRNSPDNGKSGMSVGLVQFDFASDNPFAPALLTALIDNLPDNVGGYPKRELRIALEQFHARNIAGYKTDDYKESNSLQAVADLAFQQFQVISAYAPAISDALKNNSVVNAALVEATNNQIAADLAGAYQPKGSTLRICEM